MTYMCLSLFFIPCLKWNKQYYVQSTCCNTVYALDSEIGRQIARGEDVEILSQHLTQVQQDTETDIKDVATVVLKRRRILSSARSAG